MIFCIISTFLVLLQNGVMMLLVRQLEEGKEPFGVLKFRTGNKTHTSQKKDMPIEKVKEDAQKFVKRFDNISFVVCVLGFILFTLIYCLVYAA
jgi:hypothetical protein